MWLYVALCGIMWLMVDMARIMARNGAREASGASRASACCLLPPGGFMWLYVALCGGIWLYVAGGR